MFPVLHGPAKLEGKVRHGLSCVDERGGNDSPTQYRLESLGTDRFSVSYTIHQTGEFGDRQLCPCLLPAARHSTTWPSWNTGHNPTTGNKRAFASGALQRELPCLFWDTREAPPCLHLRDIPEQSFPVPLRRGNVLTMLIKHSREVPFSSPQNWVPATYPCNTPAWAARQIKELGNSWQRNPVHCIIIPNFYQKMPLLPSVQDLSQGN